MNIIKRLPLAASLFMLLPLTGCLSVADAVGYDNATLNNAAAKSYTEVVHQAQSRQLIDTSSNTSKRVHAVFNRLKPYANEANSTGVPFIWQMTVVKSDDMNAWAMPGGKMMVASITAAEAFSIFKPCSVSWRLISSSSRAKVSSCANQLRKRQRVL